MKKPEILILVLVLLATAAKLYCAFTTIGSVDIYYFRQYGQLIADQGIMQVYEKNPMFSHPPLFGVYIGYAYEWAGPIVARFATYIRLPGIVADLVTILALLWVRRKTGRPASWALGLLAVSPLSFMVSGYHGNFDSVIAMGTVLAVAACVGGEPLLCGAMLGFTCQVKIIPLLMAPAFFFFWLHRGKARPFAFGAFGVGIAGFLLPLLSMPGLFLHRVMGYNSMWGWWGFPYLIGLMGGPKLNANLIYVPSVTEAVLTFSFKALIVAVAITLAWRRRKSAPVDLFSTLALSWAVFFVFTPGFGVQYLVWMAPFLLVHSERWFAIYTAAASIALGIFYTVSSNGFPWFIGFNIHPTMGVWGPWLLLPWGVLIAFLAFSISQRKRDLRFGGHADSEARAISESRPGFAVP